MGVKASSGMGLPMFHEMSIQRHNVSSHPFPPPSLYIKKIGLGNTASGTVVGGGGGGG
jgi:hypothetical protein